MDNDERSNLDSDPLALMSSGVRHAQIHTVRTTKMQLHCYLQELYQHAANTFGSFSPELAATEGKLLDVQQLACLSSSNECIQAWPMRQVHASTVQPSAGGGRGQGCLQSSMRDICSIRRRGGEHLLVGPFEHYRIETKKTKRKKAVSGLGALVIVTQLGAFGRCFVCLARVRHRRAQDDRTAKTTRLIDPLKGRFKF